jgi:hypothetical protein
MLKTILEKVTPKTNNKNQKPLVQKNQNYSTLIENFKKEISIQS